MSELEEIRIKVSPHAADELRRRYKVFIGCVGKHIDFSVWAGEKLAGTVPDERGLGNV